VHSAAVVRTSTACSTISSQLLTRLAAVVEDDDLHGKETIDLSVVESQRKEEEELYEKSRKSIDEDEEEYTPTATPKETQMYEALGVQPDSSAGQIKKAYYKLAMTHHPDKGGDTEEFQKIGDAYQVRVRSSCAPCALCYRRSVVVTV
tara:strand:- start:40 stop:483 length:444 start_codon:yes stop_codon:yes gene_type:complete